MNPPRLGIFGAGPIGIEAAMLGKNRGWEVVVLEAGQVGENLLRWGSTSFFTPLGMNVSARIAALRPDLDSNAFLRGPQFVHDVLRPLARELDVREQHRVVGVSRRKIGRTEYAGHPLRAKRPFEVLVDTPVGEQIFCFDGICDATGVYGNPGWLGRGGMPALGERRRQIWRHLPKMEEDEAGWRNASVVVVGNGASAATVMLELGRLKGEGGGVVHWLVPDDRSRPVEEVPEDPLPGRRALFRAANELAQKSPPWLTVLRRAAIEEIFADTMRVATRAGSTVIPCERLVGLVGYRPENHLLGELTIATDPAFEGSPGLARALARITDCLAKVEVTCKDLESGEPDYFLVGHRAYGRRSRFLLQTGLEQLEIIFENWKLLRRD